MTSVNITPLALDWQKPDWTVRITFIVAMISASVAGLFGNLLIIGTIVLIRDLRTTRNAFLANLALSDLILIAVVVPFNIISVVHGSPYWHERISLCIFVGSICAPGCLAAIWSVTGIAVNRYFFICHNDYYDWLFSPLKTFFWILSIWFISFTIHLPNHVGWGALSYVEKFYLCTRETQLWTYSTFYSVVGIILPITLSFFSYCQIYNLVRKTTFARHHIIHHKIPCSPGAIEIDTLTGELVDPTAGSMKFWRDELKLVKTLFRSFAVFLLSWLPLAILLMLPMLEDIPAWVYLLTVFLTHGSTASNSLIYYFTNEKLREGFRTIVGRFLT